jgi:putative ABC transport system permease protein
MSSFGPIKSLKGSGYSQGGRSPLRNVLVVSQFAIAIGLIVGTTLAVQQLNFMKTQDTGYNHEQVVVVPMNSSANESYETLKDELLGLAHVRNVTASIQRLGNNIHQNGMRAEGPQGTVRMAPSHLSVDFNYVSFYGMHLIAGRAFSEDLASDHGDAYIINEAMVEEVGWDDPIGQPISMSWKDSMGTVIGVVKDFNFNSLHHKIQPIALSVQGWNFSEMSIQVDGTDMSQTLAGIEAIWDRHVGDRPFSYVFLDEHFSALYASDQQVSRVVGLIALLAIAIACMGLFGLALFTTQERTKEIGIRKTLGATIPGLVFLLTKRFTLLVLVAFVVAVPVTYLLMEHWLQNFAYHIDIGVWVFAGAGLVSLLIAFLTVSYHAIATARSNPVEALRYE